MNIEKTKQKSVIGSAQMYEEPKGANGGTPLVIEQPIAWISRESLWRLKQGGNHAGVVDRKSVV